MPNRVLKETICTSETLDMLTPLEERLFYRLLVQCDDFGRMDARPAILRAKCFPLKVDGIALDEVEFWVQALSTAGLLHLYVVEGKPYLQIATWEKHQQRRARYSKYPAPPGEVCKHMLADDITCQRVLEHVPEEREARHGLRGSNNEERGARHGQRGLNNEERGTRPAKQAYAPVVTMTQEEHAKLVERFGDADAADRIQALSLYKRSKGKQYRSDYATILSWARRDAKERPAPELPTHAVRDLSAPRDGSSANES